MKGHFTFDGFLAVDTKRSRRVGREPLRANRAAAYCALTEMAVRETILSVVDQPQAIFEAAAVTQLDLWRRILEIPDHSTVHQWTFSQDLTANLFFLAL